MGVTRERRRLRRRRGIPSSAGARSMRATRCSSSSAPPTQTLTGSRTPDASTSTVRPTATTLSGAECIAAWDRIWPGSSCGWRCGNGTGASRTIDRPTEPSSSGRRCSVRCSPSPSSSPAVETPVAGGPTASLASAVADLVPERETHPRGRPPRHGPGRSPATHDERRSEARAGLSRGTVYRYFPTKEDLLAVMAEYEQDRFADGLRGLWGPRPRRAARARERRQVHHHLPARASGVDVDDRHRARVRARVPAAPAAGVSPDHRGAARPGDGGGAAGAGRLGDGPRARRPLVARRAVGVPGSRGKQPRRGRSARGPLDSFVRLARAERPEPQPESSSRSRRARSGRARVEGSCSAGSSASTAAKRSRPGRCTGGIGRTYRGHDRRRRDPHPHPTWPGCGCTATTSCRWRWPAPGSMAWCCSARMPSPTPPARSPLPWTRAWPICGDRWPSSSWERPRRTC